MDVVVELAEDDDERELLVVVLALILVLVLIFCALGSRFILLECALSCD